MKARLDFQKGDDCNIFYCEDSGTFIHESVGEVQLDLPLLADNDDDDADSDSVKDWQTLKSELIDDPLQSAKQKEHYIRKILEDNPDLYSAGFIHSATPEEIKNSHQAIIRSAALIERVGEWLREVKGKKGFNKKQGSYRLMDAPSRASKKVARPLLYKNWLIQGRFVIVGPLPDLRAIKNPQKCGLITGAEPFYKSWRAVEKDTCVSSINQVLLIGDL